MLGENGRFGQIWVHVTKGGLVTLYDLCWVVLGPQLAHPLRLRAEDPFKYINQVQIPRNGSNSGNISRVRWPEASRVGLCHDIQRQLGKNHWDVLRLWVSTVLNHLLIGMHPIYFTLRGAPYNWDPCL